MFRSDAPDRMVLIKCCTSALSPTRKTLSSCSVNSRAPVSISCVRSSSSCVRPSTSCVRSSSSCVRRAEALRRLSANSSKIHSRLCARHSVHGTPGPPVHWRCKEQMSDWSSQVIEGRQKPRKRLHSWKDMRSRYPGSTLLAFLTCRRRSFHAAVIRWGPSTVSSGQLATSSITCAAWKRTARRNGSERSANFAHCGGGRGGIERMEEGKKKRRTEGKKS